MAKKVLGYDLSADEWNRIIYAVNAGKTTDNAGWNLSDEEKELFEHMKKKRDDMMKKYPGSPITIAPVEKDWD